MPAKYKPKTDLIDPGHGRPPFLYVVRPYDPEKAAKERERYYSWVKARKSGKWLARHEELIFTIRGRVTETIEDMRARKDAAYEERNRLVAILAFIYQGGIKRTDIEGWDAEWHGCVYIDLPTGQVSWHYHDSHAHLFDGLRPYDGEWDGHTTEEKYRRLAALRLDPQVVHLQRHKAH